MLNIILFFKTWSSKASLRYVCTYVRMHAGMHVHACMFTHAHISIRRIGRLLNKPDRMYHMYVCIYVYWCMYMIACLCIRDFLSWGLKELVRLYVQVCMYVCMPACLHACMPVWLHASCLQTLAYLRIHTLPSWNRENRCGACMCAGAYMYVCMYAYMHAYKICLIIIICVSIMGVTRIYANTVYVYTCTHTHTHTHI